MKTRPGSRSATDSEACESEALQLLGLARRAGSLVPGVGATRQAVRELRATLVVTAGDASATQLSKVVGVARRRGIPVRAMGDRERLGRAVGRGPTSAVAVTEKAIAEQLLRRLAEPERGEVTPP